MVFRFLKSPAHVAVEREGDDTQANPEIGAQVHISLPFMMRANSCFMTAA
jgi:hypothetical protein